MTSNSPPLVWNDYFMFLALLSAKRSKDPITQVGACIVDHDNRIVSIGYNGFPRKCHDDEFPWGKSEDEINNKKLYVVHAEANAILNKKSTIIRDMSLYTTLFPCNECTKLIIQSGIKSIYYLSDKYSYKVNYQASRRMFKAAKIECIRLEPHRFDLRLDFNEVIPPDLSSPNLETLQKSFTDHCKVGTEKVSPSTSSALLQSSSPSLLVSGKRLDYIKWDDYFMAIALLSAKRSKDPDIQVGACIVDDNNRIVAIGFNGLPRSCDDNKFPLKKSNSDINDKKHYIIHAEANAILNKNSTSIDNMRLFTTRFPCNECSKLIIQSGIGQIIYLSDPFENKPKLKASKRMLQSAKIAFQRFVPEWNSIELDFNEIMKEDPSISNF